MLGNVCLELRSLLFGLLENDCLALNSISIAKRVLWKVD